MSPDNELFGITYGFCARTGCGITNTAPAFFDLYAFCYRLLNNDRSALAPASRAIFESHPVRRRTMRRTRPSFAVASLNLLKSPPQSDRRNPRRHLSAVSFFSPIVNSRAKRKSRFTTLYKTLFSHPGFSYKTR